MIEYLHDSDTYVHTILICHLQDFKIFTTYTSTFSILCPKDLTQTVVQTTIYYLNKSDSVYLRVIVNLRGP